MNPYFSLSRINHDFVARAKHCRWELSPGRFTNRFPEGRNRDDIEMGWLRSIRGKKRSTFLFPIDIDGKDFSLQTINSSFALGEALYDIVGEIPHFKASGRSGAHLYYLFYFPDNWTEFHVLEQMKNLAYTAYLNSKMAEDGYLFGPIKKDALPSGCPGFVDTCIYRIDGMIRGYSIHPNSGLYSVPYRLGEAYDVVRGRMRLMCEMPFEKFQHIKFNPRWKLDKYEETELFSRRGLLPNLSHLRDMVDSDYKGDKYYQSLPDSLKAIVRMGSDVKHELKWPLVAHMRFYWLMEPGQIAEWILRRCKWSDLDNKEITYDQCYATCKWVDRAKIISNPEGLSLVNNIPLPEIYYEERNEE